MISTSAGVSVEPMIELRKSVWVGIVSAGLSTMSRKVR